MQQWRFSNLPSSEKLLHAKFQINSFRGWKIQKHCYRDSFLPTKICLKTITTITDFFFSCLNSLFLSSHLEWHLQNHDRLSVVHISKHSPFHVTDSQDQGRLSVEHISKHSNYVINTTSNFATFECDLAHGSFTVLALQFTASTHYLNGVLSRLWRL